jgi:hypothetical protein
MVAYNPNPHPVQPHLAVFAHSLLHLITWAFIQFLKCSKVFTAKLSS